MGRYGGAVLRAQIPSALANTLEQAGHQLGASFNPPCSMEKERGTGKIVGKHDARSCGEEQSMGYPPQLSKSAPK